MLPSNKCSFRIKRVDILTPIFTSKRYSQSPSPKSKPGLTRTDGQMGRSRRVLCGMRVSCYRFTVSPTGKELLEVFVDWWWGRVSSGGTGEGDLDLARLLVERSVVRTNLLLRLKHRSLCSDGANGRCTSDSHVLFQPPLSFVSSLPSPGKKE